MAQTEDGAVKVAAQRIGTSEDIYRHRLSAGLKWCTGCKAWHERSNFPVDRSRGDGLRARCLAATHGEVRTERDPEKEKARHAVGYALRTGELPHPNTIACTDCGHLWPDRRHEYDHYLGYSLEHHLDVEPVCTLCHADREKSRNG